MTPEERDEFRTRNEKRRRLRDAATKGPWKRCGGATARYQAIHSPDGYIVFGMADARHDSEGGKFVDAPNYPQQMENANFIAHARNDTAPEDVDALLAEVERLNEELKRKEVCRNAHK
jgi:hypothetical protein